MGSKKIKKLPTLGLNKDVARTLVCKAFLRLGLVHALVSVGLMKRSAHSYFVFHPTNGEFLHYTTDILWRWEEDKEREEDEQGN